MFSFISQAYADADTGAGITSAIQNQPSIIGQVVILGIFVAVFWLLIWRPQSKRNKEHKNLINNLTKGDEVATTGGILGKVVRVNDNFITLEIAKSIEIDFQKHAIASTLPKGTLKALKN